MTLSTALSSWFVSKNAFLLTVQLFHIIVSIYNFFRTTDLLLKQTKSPAPTEPFSTYPSQDEVIDLGRQIISGILQFTSGHYYHNIKDPNPPISRRIPGQNVTEPNPGLFSSIFNSKTATYVSFMEKIAVGLINLLKGLGEIGAMGQSKSK